MTSQWTIYCRPRDYPLGYVVREWRIDAAGAKAMLKAFLAPTLELARAAVPPDAHNLGRYPEDDPVIVETWI